MATEEAEDVAAHGTPEAAAEYGAVGMPQLDPAIWPNLIFWLVVSLVLLYFILSRFALPRLGAILAERHDAISSDLEMAALFRRRAQEAEAAYERALAEAREEASRIGDAARQEVQKELRALMAKADAEIAAKAAESERRIGEIRASATESIETVARDVAEAIVERLMPQLADRAAVEVAVSAELKG